MKQSKKAKEQYLPLFTADSIMTKLDDALHRDLSRSNLLEYGPIQPHRQLYADSQLANFTKKFVSQSVRSKSNLSALTFEKFERINQHMERFRFNLPLPNEVDVRPKDRTYRDKVLLRARSLVHMVMLPFMEEEFFNACKHSGGSSIGVPFVDTSIEAKCFYPMTVTKGVETWFERYLDFDTTMKSAIQELNSKKPNKARYQIVSGSRGTTVPKTNKIDRMIAVEPTGNMFFQQGLMEMMYDRLQYVGLDVTTLPDTHKKLAQRGSVHGNLATIDFSSASDCVSPALLKWLLPGQWYHWLDKFRSPTIEVDGKVLELNMFSTMGNATTFPLETLVFWSIATAVCSANRDTTFSGLVRQEHKSLCSVFGDDCILPTSDAYAFICVCESVGFVVNTDKSYFDQQACTFRESCGGDYHSGFDVRSVYLSAPTSDRKSSLEPWLYNILNQLLEKHKSCFGVGEPVVFATTIREILSILFQMNIYAKLVPGDFPEDSGIHGDDFLEWLYCHFKGSWSPLAESVHGSITFRYCRYQYKTKSRMNLHLRYSLKLKCFVFDRRKRQDMFKPIRKKGGYVVSKAVTAHWTVPLQVAKS